MKLNVKLKQLILKSIRVAALSGTLTMFSATALGAVANNTLPTGLAVMGGNATASTTGAIMDVNQTSKNAAIKWDSFNIGANATVNFKYNGGFNGSYNILNYSTNANKASEIYGHLHAGSGANVWIINPNGVIIGQGAKIEVGSLHVATAALDTADFTNFINNAPSITTMGSYQPAELMSLGEIYADKITFDGNKVVLDADALHKYNGSTVNIINNGTVVLGEAGNTTNGYLQVKHAEDGVVGYTAASSATIKLNGSRDVAHAWITNLEQLQKIGKSTTTLGQKYALKNNIDATATAAGTAFTPIGTNTNKFTGVLEGLGHDIYGLTINMPDADNVGLFGVIGDNAAIRNLNLIGGAIVGNSNVGGVVGYAKDSATIENVNNSARVLGVDNVGGIVGTVYGTSASNPVKIINAENLALIRGNANVGGIAGSIINGNITGATSNNGTIKGIVNFKQDAQYEANKTKGAQALVDAKYKDISGETTSAPSIIKYSVAGCVFNMEYVSTDDNGVMFGKVLSANLEHATNSNASTWAQNIIGKYGKISKTGEGYYSFVTYLDINTPFLIDGNTYHFTGVQQSTEIINGYDNRNNINYIDANGHQVGGLAGYAQYATIGNASLSQYQIHNDGLVTGANDIGGLVGLADGNVTIRNAANYGTIGDAAYKAYGSNVGGLVGSLKGDISISYNQGSIYNGLDNTGGLVGSMQGGSMTEVFNAGDISVEMQKDADATNVGGLVGDLRNGKINSAYNVGKISSFVKGDFTGYNRAAGIVGSVKNFSGPIDWQTIFGVYSTTEILAKKGNNKQNHGDAKVDLHPLVAIAGDENKKLTGYGYFIYPEDYAYNKGTTAYNGNYAVNGKYSSLSTYLNSHSNTDGTHGILYSERFLFDNVSVFRGLPIGSISASGENITNKSYTATSVNPTFAGQWHMYLYDKATGQAVSKHSDGKYYTNSGTLVADENVIGTLPMLNAFTPSNKGSLTEANIKYVQYGTEENPLATFVTLNDGSVTTYYPEGGINTAGANNASKVLIESAEQLKNELANSGLNKHYILVNDINAAEIAGAISNGTFTGILDGNGHSIYGLSDSLFAANSGTIKNLTLSGAYITAASEGFGLLAKTNTGTIDNVATLGNTIKAAANNVGGLVGTNNGTITNARLEDIVYANGHSNIGGATAVNSQAINNIMAQTALTSTGAISNVGSIAASNTGAVANIANYGPISLASGSSIGGIVGTNSSSGTLKDALNYGYVTVNAGQNIGGLVGANSSSAAQALDNLENYAAIAAPHTSAVGGIVGSNSGQLEKVTLINHSSAAITGVNKVGGIAGTNSGTLSGGRDENNNYYKHEIYNNAAITALNDGNAGGVAGLNSGTINLAYNTGVVTGRTIGDVMGYDSNNSFTNSFSSTHSGNIIHEALFKTSIKLVLASDKSLNKVYDGTGEDFSLNVATDADGFKHAYVYQGTEKLGELQAVDPNGKHTLQDFFDSYSEAQGAVNLLSGKNTDKDAGSYNVLTSMQIVGENKLGFCLGTPSATSETNDFLNYTINKKQLSTSANTVQRTYGNAAITSGSYGFTLSGFVAADGAASKNIGLASSSVTDNAITGLSFGQATKNAGEHSWTSGYSLDAATAKNYTLGASGTAVSTATIQGTSKINKADLTIQLKDVVMSYGASQAGAIGYTDATDSHKDHVLKSGVASTYDFTVAGAVNGDSANNLHSGINIANTNYVNSGFNADGTTKDVVYGSDNQPIYAYNLTLAEPSNISANDAVSQNYNLNYSNASNSGKVMITPVVLSANGSTVYRTYGDATVYFDPQSKADRAPIGSSSNAPDLGQIKGWLNDDANKKATVGGQKKALYQWVYLDQDEQGFENVKDGAVLDAKGNKYTDGRQTSDVGTYKWTEGTWKMETALLNSALKNYRLYDGSKYVTELGAGGDSIVEMAALTLQLNNVETSYGTAFNTNAANTYGYSIKELANGATINGIDSLDSIKAALGIQNSSYANAYDHKEGVANSVTGNAGTYNLALGLKADGYKNLSNYNITINNGNIKINPVELKLMLNDVTMQYAATEGVKNSTSALNEAGVATTNIANQYGLKSISLVNGDSLESVLGTISYHNSGFNGNGSTRNVTYGPDGQPVQTQWQEGGVTKYAELTASFTQSDTTNYKTAMVTPGKVTITPVILEAKGSTVYYTYGDVSRYYFADKNTANRENITPTNFQDQAVSGWLGADGDKKATVGGTEKELRLWVAVEIKDNIEDVDDHALTPDRKGTKEVGQYTWSNGSMTMEASLTNDPEALGNYRFWKLPDGDAAGYYAISKPVEGISFVEKADLTININNQTKTYGDVLDAYSFTVQGADLAPGNDTITRKGEASNAALQQTLSSLIGGYNDHGAKSTVPGRNTGDAGSYVLEFNNSLVNQDLLHNYDIKAVNNGTVTINKANLNLTVNDVTMRYASSEGTAGASSLYDEAGVAYTNIANQYGIKGNFVNGDSSNSVLGAISYKNSGFNEDGSTKNVSYDAKGQPLASHTLEATYTPTSLANNYNITVTQGKVTITPVVLDVKGSTVYRDYGNPTYYFAPHDVPNRESIPEGDLQDNKLTGWLNASDEYHLSDYVSMNIGQGAESIVDHALSDDGTSTKEPGIYAWYNGYVNMNPHFTNSILANYRFWQLPDGDIPGQYATEKHVGGASIVEAVGPAPQPKPDKVIQPVIIKDIYPWLSEKAQIYNYALTTEYSIPHYPITIINGGMYFFDDMTNIAEQKQATESKK